jgi:hypothetical protein
VLLRLRKENSFVSRAHFGSIPIARVEISIDEPQFRWMREHGALHIPDARAQNDFQMVGSVANFRTWLAVPLREQGELIGGLIARRNEVRPFTPAQIKLLETFRRSGRHRDRERSAVSRAHRSVGAADGYK